MYKRFLLILLLVIASISFLYSDLTEEFLFISNLYNDGYYDTALREIARIEPNLPEDQFGSQIRSLQADILIKQENYPEARVILNRLDALPLTPELRGQVMLNLAIVERNLGNTEAAYRLVSEYQSRFPDSSRAEDAYQLLGDIYVEQNNFEEAERLYAELHKQKSTEQTYVNLIRLNATLERFTEAENYLNNLKTDFPRAYSAHQQGLLFILKGHESRANYIEIIELCPPVITPETAFTEAIILSKIVAYANLRNFDEVQRLLSEIKTDTMSADYYRGLVHKERGENNQALVIFGRLMESPAASSEIKAMSFFNLAQITALQSPREANQLLQNYLINNPDQEWEGDILYQLAFLEYQNDNFEEAYDFVLRSLRFNLSLTNLQKALYLKGELEFLLDRLEDSHQTFLENLDKMPEAFLDEALFKIALCNFFLGRPDNASRYFTQLIMNHPGSDKIGVAYFYLGEIELHRNLGYARSNYQQAFSGRMDEGAIRLRLAYVDYMRLEYDAAIAMLNLVPETSDYMYDKNLLMGNIYFAQRDFPAALEAYRIAERSATDQVSVEYIWSRQAWTHYNLKNYDTATMIYRRLAEQSDSPGMYVLSAAGAALNAENYEQASELYREFIETYPDDSEVNRAQSGLANCYFNMGLYVAAIDAWSTLVHEDNNANIVESALKGMQTSYQRLDRVSEFIEFLNLQRLRFTRRDFIINLYEYKAQFEYEQKNYSSSVATLNQLIREYPEKSQDQKIMVLLANNYSWLMQYSEADAIYLELARRSDDPYIYYEWGNIRWAQRDYEAAMTRYKRAADNSQNELYWTTLLDKMVERRDNDFMRYYNEFSRFASDYHRHLAMLNLIDWCIYTTDYNRAFTVAEEIIDSGFAQLRPRATFKKAEVYFLQGRYEEALTDFLRIRYIFNEYSDIRWASELYIAKIYLAQGDRDRAKNQFDSIMPNLTPEQIAEFNALWN